MVKDPVAIRYADALFELARSQDHVDETLAELEELGGLIKDSEELRQFLLNPGVEVADKLQVLGRLLGKLWSVGLRAFVQMVLSMGRGAYLLEMLEAFRAMADAERRLLRATVRAAHPLPELLKDRLKQRIEQRERCTVELTEEIDPELIGGMQLFLDNRILDGSLKAQLKALRQRLKSVRVH